MLSKLAKEQDNAPDAETAPLSVSPNTGYSSWFNVWNSTKNVEVENDSSTDSSDNEIFKI